MAAVPLRTPWVSTLNQTVGNAPQSASYRSASDFLGPGGGDNGLAALARGLGQLGGAMFEVGIKDRQEQQDLALLQDVQDFRRQSDQFISNYMAQNQGELGINAGQVYQAWFEQRSVELDKKWGQSGLGAQKYLLQNVGGIGTSGYHSMLGYGRQQQESWNDSLFQSDMADFERQSLNPNATPGQIWAAGAGQSRRIEGYYQSKGLLPGAAKWEAEQNQRKNLKANLEARLAAGIAAEPGQVGFMLNSPEFSSERKQSLTPPAAAEPYMGLVNEASSTYGVPQEIILAVMQTESGFRAGAVSPTNVKGLMQVTQDTYNGLGFTGNRADPRNSIMAGTKLLGQLYKQYGNWDDAFAAYNGGAHAVTGLREGKWGGIDAAKQREIRNYAPTVKQNLAAMKGGMADLGPLIESGDEAALIRELFTPMEIESYREKAGKALDEEVKAAADREVDRWYADLKGQVSGLPFDEQVSKLTEMAADIPDRDVRQRVLTMAKQDLESEKMRRAASDQVAIDKYLEFVETKGLLPSEAIAGVKSIENIYPEGRTKLEDLLIKGTYNKETPNNRAALAELRAAIDRGDIVSSDGVEAFVYDHGLTKGQANKALTYLQRGGQAGLLQQKMVNSAWESLGLKKNSQPVGLYDQVLSQLKPGEHPNHEIVKRIIANLRMDGENSATWGFGYGGDESYIQALKNGRADTWLPDVTSDEKAEIEAVLQALGMNSPTDEEIRKYKKYEIMGIPYLEDN